jgi:uncharacterized protein (DUF2062 family)
MPSSLRLKVTPHNAAAVIGVFIGLFAVFVVAPVVANVIAHVLVYGFTPNLMSPIVHWLQ